MSTFQPVVYTDITQLVNELNLVQDVNNPNNYFVWSVSTPYSVIQHFIDQANEYTTALFGDLSNNPNFFVLARQYATKWAALRLVQNISINWTISGMRWGAGGIEVSRLEAMRTAISEVKERLKTDLKRLYIMISEVAGISAYQPPSPYVDTGGSLYWL